MGTLRKILTTGVGAALMTESSLRNALSEIKVTQQARDYLSKTLAGEIRKFLGHINLHREIQKALTGLTFEIAARVKIESAGDQVKASIKNVRVKKV